MGNHLDKRNEADNGRRDFLAVTSSVVMAGGLAAGYGTFFAMAGRYFYPSGDNKVWLFVAETSRFHSGESFSFQSPAGVNVTITRREEPTEQEPTSGSFLALSSVCPHLGCRVHWESHNDRFFCPCHNGVFDPTGKATGGPPAADGQDLPQYPVKIVDGAVYIQMPLQTV